MKLTDLYDAGGIKLPKKELKKFSWYTFDNYYDKRKWQIRLVTHDWKYSRYFEFTFFGHSLVFIIDYPNRRKRDR